MSTNELRDWVLTYKANSRAHVEIWAVIAGVPAGVDRAEVESALETWARWPHWASRMGMSAVRHVTPMTQRHRNIIDGVVTLDGPAMRTTTVQWSEIAPESKRLGLEMPGDLHARLVLAARRSGQSLNQWVIECLSKAAAIDDLFAGNVDRVTS